MALLVEAYCVIIKVSSIEKIFPGGMKEFHLIIPSGVYYADDNLLAVGFMNPTDARIFHSKLLKYGFGDFDVAFVSQTSGMMYLSKWLTLSDFEMEGGHVVMIAYLKEEEPVKGFIAPFNWQFEKSLSDEAIVIQPDSDRMEFVSNVNGLITYYDKQDGRYLYAHKVS